MKSIATVPLARRLNNRPIFYTIEMRKFIVFLVFVLCCLDLYVSTNLETAESTPVIYTSTGPVRGEVLTTIVKSVKYSSFRSIRYAEPPYGFNRFKPPIPVKPWTDIVNATIEASACPQVNLITNHYAGKEDCLFINVFTPMIEFNESKQNGKAVMVWIYGGSFISGNANTSLFGPDFLIEDDVILVTLNYRVGAFGFLNLYHPNATGNAGIKDQALALRWIKENIAKFGGDDEKITIFGNSAGAASVDLQTLSNRSEGLFHRVISLSGSLFSSWSIQTPEEAIARSFELGALLGVSTTNKEYLLRRLCEATPYELAMKTKKMGQVMPPFLPTIEDPIVAGSDAFLTEHPIDKYKSGNFQKLPYITGYTAKETAYLFTNETIEPIIKLVESAIGNIDKIRALLQFNGSTVTNLLKTTRNALEQVPNATLDEYVEKTSFEYFKAGIDLKQRFLYEQSPEPVYYYQVSFNPAETLHELLYHIHADGACHSDDLAYMFYIPVVDLPIDESHPVSVTRRRVVRMWTNFAKYGNPTPDGELDPLLRITWPPSGSSGLHLEIDEELSVGPRPVDTRDKYLELVTSQYYSKFQKILNP